MKKIWLVAKATYLQRVTSGNFLILTFGLPLLMIAAGAISFFAAGRVNFDEPVGFVDRTRELAAIQQIVYDERMLQFRDYPSREAAQEAWQAGEIQGFLMVPEGYFEGQEPVFYSDSQPSAAMEDALVQFMRKAMAPDIPEAVLERLQDPSEITYVAVSTGERVSAGPGLIIRFATPAALALLFALAIMFTSSQMGAAIVREKDQRAMEIVITSLRAVELVAGKILGMSLLTLTQFGIWGLGGGIALALALSNTGGLVGISLPWGALIWATLLTIPGYFLFAVLAAGLGVIAGDIQQAQQLAGLLGFVGLFPLWFAAPLVSQPDSSLAVGLTLFPLTAPVFALFRMTLTEVPFWQLAASVGILVASLAFSVWAVARIFRAAMLIYGQALRPKEILRALIGS